MKKALLSIALSAFVFSLIAGTGLSADSPLTVSQALAKKNDRKSYYINGYIVGEYRDYSNRFKQDDARTNQGLCRFVQFR